MIYLDKNEVHEKPTVQQRRKIGWSLKALKAAYNRLPKSIKNKFGSQAKFLAVLGAFEQFTRDIQAKIIKELTAQGFIKTQATIVAKTITFLAF